MKHFFLLLLLCLVGCEKIKDSFGLTHSTPDELALMDQPDLIVPPVFSQKPQDPIYDANEILRGKK